MNRIHEGLEDKDFEMPASVEKASVCSETGLLPRSGCPTITEYFDISSLPTEYCDQHFYGSSDSYDEDSYNYDEDSDSDSAADAIPTAAPDSTDTGDNGDNTDNGSGDNTDNTDNGDDNSGSDDGSDDTGGDSGDDGSGDDGGDSGYEEDPVEYYE